MAEPTPPVPRLWGIGAPPPPGRPRRLRLLLVILGLVLVTGVGVGLLYWFLPPRTPAALTVWITAGPGESGPVPWAEQDRAALTEAGVLGRQLDDPAANPNRDQVRLRFKALSRQKPAVPVVTYLAAPASVDAAGGVYILPADALGDHPRNRLPLAELLGYFRDCPARHKLLILQLTPPAENPLFAPRPGDLSAAVFRSLDETPDANRLCLVACGPGQTAHASADLGRTVFGYYVEAGIRGAADGWGGDRDGHVSTAELAAFVRSRVTRWAAMNVRSPQTPVLVGTAEDFSLAAYSRERLIDRYPIPPATGDAGANSAFLFPAWLRTAWERHDRWLVDGRANGAPRAFTLLRSALLGAERNLLAGRAAGEVQQSLDSQLAALDKLAATLSAVPTPNPLPTLAATFPGYTPPDPNLVRDLREAVLRTDGPVTPPAAAPGAPGASAATAPLPAEFDAFKAKPYPELALAAFLVLAEDGPPSATRVKNLSRLLVTKEPTPKFAEVLLIRRLAELAGGAIGGAWSRERAGLALQAARDLEDAAARPGVIVWAKPALDDAYRLRADAEAVLFAPGFAPPDEADRRLPLAAAAARQLRAFAERLHTATATRDEAVRWITGATPTVATGLINTTDALALADAARGLADSLTLPAAPLDSAALASQVQDWQQKEAAVRAALVPVARLFTTPAVAKLRNRAAQETPTPDLLAEVDVILSTPLLPVAARAALWDARAAVTHRLNQDALRKDAADEDSYRKGFTKPDAPDPRDVPRSTANDGADARRVKWSIAMMRLGGVAESDRVAEELQPLAANAAGTAGRLRRAWLEEIPASLQRGTAPTRLVRVIPAVPAAAFLDQPARNPRCIARRAHALAMWAWQAARFAYETRDPTDPTPTDIGFKFTSSAARACAAIAPPTADPYLELIPGPEPVLTAKNPQGELGLGVRLLGSTEPRGVAVRVLSPSPDWLKIGREGEAKLGPIREQAVRLPIAAGDRPYLHPESRGVLLEATIENGRVFHRRTPIGLASLVNRLDLVARAGPTGPTLRTLDLRPNGESQTYQLLLSNPTPRPRKVIARLAGFGRETAEITVPPGDVAVLVFPPPPPATPAAALPPAPKGPPPEPVFDPIRGGELVVEVFDPANRDKPVDRLTLPVRALHPTEYVKVEGVTFQPAIGSRPNRLAAEVVPGRVPPGPPCMVRVTLPRDRNPDIVKVRDANLSAPLPADGRPVTLYAESTAFAGLSGANAVVTVNIDNCERMYTFAGFLPPLGGTVRLAPVSEPMIRVRARPAPPAGLVPPPPPPGTPPEPEPYVEPVYTSGLVPLPVELEVDNAPDGATVELRVGVERLDLETFVPEFLTDLVYPADPLRNPVPAKVRTVGLRFDPKGESFLIRATLQDPWPKLPLEFVVGERVIEARLLGPGGKPVLDSRGQPVVGRTQVVFDGTPPTNVRFIGLAPRVRKDQPLLVKATSDPTVSGIKEVRFFFGKPVNGAPPSGVATVPGVLVDPKGNEWRATLPVAGLPERVTVGVLVVSKSGAAAVAAEEIELVDPAVLNKPVPGIITGKVTDNRLPQPKLKVFLYDAAAKPLRESTTNTEGVYEFKAVPPGTYFVYTYHELTRRQDKKQVDLKPAETHKQDLELLLK